MTYVYSPDGTIVAQELRSLPAKHWEQTSVDPPLGQWHELTVGNAASHGYYETTVIGTDQGDGWFLADPVNNGPGVFEEHWTFSQPLADQIADETSRSGHRDRAGRQRQKLRGFAQDMNGHAPVTNNPQAQAFCNEIMPILEVVCRSVADIISGELRNDDPGNQDP